MYVLVCFKNSSNPELLEIVIQGAFYYSFYMTKYDANISLAPQYPNCKFWTL